MKTLLLTLLFSANVYAGDAKFFFTHDYKATDGSPVTLTGFNFYWGFQGQPLSNKIPYGPPAPIPYKVVAGMYHYAKTLSNVAWAPGTTVCWALTAVAGELESDPTGPVCKVYSQDPNAPVIIDVTIP